MGLYAKTVRSLSIGSTTDTLDSKPSSGVSSRWRRFSTGSTLSTASSSDGENSVQECAKLRKVVRFRNLKHGGTTIKNDSGNFEYFYNPLEIGTNPYNIKSMNEDGGYSVELSVDSLSRSVYLSDIQTQAANASTPSRTSPAYADSSTAVIPDPALHNSAGVTVSGKLILRVLQENKPVYVKSQCIRLKCFVYEFVCMTDTAKREHSSNKRIIKMLDDDDTFSRMLPYKEINVDIYAGDEPFCLNSGTHEFPFSFLLQGFPASVSTYFGKTFYRLESVTQVVRNVNKRPWTYDTIILTDEINVKRILSTTSSNLKHESIFQQGNWNKGELNYSVMVNTKLVEIGVPFSMQFGFMRDTKSVKNLDKITVSLAQSITIPCADSKNSQLLPSSYSKANEVELYRIDVSLDTEKNADDVGNNFQYYEIGNLKIPPSDRGELCRNWLRPYYCEPSTKYTNRARLKITHAILLRLILSNTDEDSASNTGSRRQSKNITCLTLRIPVLLVDQDMSNNLWLPPYRDSPTSDPVPQDEPPSYYRGYSIEPPNYLTERST